MAELVGLELSTHLESICSEFSSKKTIYGYPEKKIYRGFSGLDFSVNFHDKKVATPLGPASGPHTQLVQNIILSFLGGGRIMELKTVQILDELEIPRPCIDARNICFNVEWSQELKLEDSLKIYVQAWVLLKILEDMEIFGVPKGDPFYNTVFDLSVGYDLKGISSEPLGRWIDQITHADDLISVMLDKLPAKFDQYKKLAIPAQIANSVTLSTFHGCPRDEIEAMVQHLISRHNLHVNIKMNPTLLGYDFVEKTLRKDLGYSHIELDPQAFEKDLQLDEALAMVKRLEKFASEHHRHLGAKFTNTLVVKNNQGVFDEQVMYLSGEPLHVLAMHTMNQFRQAMGDSFPISFSAGLSKQNFVDAVLCRMVPLTTCTDLLRPGGYTRLYGYLENLQKAMEKKDVSSIDELICKTADEKDPARGGAKNAQALVPMLVNNPRYHHNKNKKIPRKIDSHLTLFDCLTCNKCLPVCPNGANFSLSTEVQKMDTTRYIYKQGAFEAVEGSIFQAEKEHQIANLAEFCNECGNCDTFCPELDGPFVKKARFFFSKEIYHQDRRDNGFYFSAENTMVATIGEGEYQLSLEGLVYHWTGPQVKVVCDKDHLEISPLAVLEEGAEIDLRPFYQMKILFNSLQQEKNGYPISLLHPR